MSAGVTKTAGVVVIMLVLAMAALPVYAGGPKLEADGTVPRIMLLGDSWPWFLSSGFIFFTYEKGSAFRDILPETFRERWSDRGATAQPGSMLMEWSQNTQRQTPYGVKGLLDYIRAELNAYPTLDIVHLCLGGNDYIRGDFRGFVYHADGRLYKEFQWQTLVFTGPPDGGTFTLTFQGQTTVPIPFNANAAAVESALADLSTIGLGNIQVQTTTGKPKYFCEFKGTFAQSDIPLMSADGSGLTGGGSQGLTVERVIFDHGWKDVWGTESPAEMAFAQTMLEQLQIVAETALDVRPDIRLLICDYDYMDEDVGGADVRATNMNLVSSGRIKLMLAEMLRAKPQYANRAFYHNAFGLMQWTFGYPCDFEKIGVAPNEEYRQITLRADQYYGPKGEAGTMGTIQKPGSYPDYTPWAGGDLNYPGPAISILYDFGKSGIVPEWAKGEKGGNIHLHKEGNHVFARYCVEQWYGKWLDQPKVLSVSRSTPDPTNPLKIFDPVGIDQVEFEVLFSEPVTGVDETDFQILMHEGLANATIVSVVSNEIGDTYKVVVTTGTGLGTLGLAVIDNGSIKAVDDGDVLAGDVNGSFSYGESYTVDRTYRVPVIAWPAMLLLALSGVMALRRRRA